MLGQKRERTSGLKSDKTGREQGPKPRVSKTALRRLSLEKDLPSRQPEASPSTRSRPVVPGPALQDLQQRVQDFARRGRQPSQSPVRPGKPGPILAVNPVPKEEMPLAVEDIKATLSENQPGVGERQSVPGDFNGDHLMALADLKLSDFVTEADFATSYKSEITGPKKRVSFAPEDLQEIGLIPKADRSSPKSTSLTRPKSRPVPNLLDDNAKILMPPPPRPRMSEGGPRISRSSRRLSGPTSSLGRGVTLSHDSALRPQVAPPMSPGLSPRRRSDSAFTPHRLRNSIEQDDALMLAHRALSSSQEPMGHRPGGQLDRRRSDPQMLVAALGAQSERRKSLDKNPCSLSRRHSLNAADTRLPLQANPGTLRRQMRLFPV